MLKVATCCWQKYTRDCSAILRKDGWWTWERFFQMGFRVHPAVMTVMGRCFTTRRQGSCL